MRSRLSLVVTVASAGPFVACASADIDEADRQSFFGDVRLRKSLDELDEKGASKAGATKVEHDGTYLELDYQVADGDTGGFGYTISALELGLAVDGRFAEKGWMGAVAGLGWLHTELDGSGLDGEDAYGPYGAVQGGWYFAPWLEAYARGQFGVYLADFSNVLGFEVGLRVHPVDHVAAFVGWHGARFNLQDLDSFTAIDLVQLDASGPAIGLEFSF